MSNVEFTDNSAEILAMLEKARLKALDTVGGKVEGWAKGLCYPKGPKGKLMKGATELRNSISHQVENGEVSVGSSMQIAPYIELGTGKEYDPPPEWIQAHSDDKHTKGGVDSWWYYAPTSAQAGRRQRRADLPDRCAGWSRLRMAEWRDCYWDENEHVFRLGLPIPAQPYLRPAFTEHMDEIRRVVEKEMKRE